VSGINALLLDFDGVILDSSATKTEAFLCMYSEFPQFYEEMKVFHYSNKGMSRYEQFKFLSTLMEREGDEEFLQLVSKRFSSLVVDMVKKCDFVNGIQDFLSYFNYISIPIHIVSNSPQVELMEIMETKGLNQYFASVVGAEPGRKKEEAINILVQHEGYHRQDLVYIGDTLGDYRASTNNGIQFVGLNNKIVKFSCSPNNIVAFDSIDQIKRYIKTLID
jgi:phosphoglycolate phosphatase